MNAPPLLIRLHAGAASRRRAHDTVTANAQRTTVLQHATTDEYIYVEYGDGQVAQFRRDTADFTPTLRNPGFVGYPILVPAGVWS